MEHCLQHLDVEVTDPLYYYTHQTYYQFLWQERIGDPSGKFHYYCALPCDRERSVLEVILAHVHGQGLLKFVAQGKSISVEEALGRNYPLDKNVLEMVGVFVTILSCHGLRLQPSYGYLVVVGS